MPRAVGVVSLSLVLCLLGPEWVWSYAVSDKEWGRGGISLFSAALSFWFLIMFLGGGGGVCVCVGGERGGEGGGGGVGVGSRWVWWRGGGGGGGGLCCVFFVVFLFFFWGGGGGGGGGGYTQLIRCIDGSNEWTGGCELALSCHGRWLVCGWVCQWGFVEWWNPRQRHTPTLAAVIVLFSVTVQHNGLLTFIARVLGL